MYQKVVQYWTTFRPAMDLPNPEAPPGPSIVAAQPQVVAKPHPKPLALKTEPPRKTFQDWIRELREKVCRSSVFEDRLSNQKKYGCGVRPAMLWFRGPRQLEDWRTQPWVGTDLRSCRGYTPKECLQLWVLVV